MKILMVGLGNIAALLLAGRDYEFPDTTTKAGLGSSFCRDSILPHRRLPS